ARVRQMATRPSRQSRPRCFRINYLALALALLFAGAEDHDAPLGSVSASRCFMKRSSAHLESTRMTHRIERSTNARGVTFILSGDMDSAHVTELEALIAAVSNRLLVLDLADVTLVNREAIGFLAGVEAAGVTLVNCPEDVRSLIYAEQGEG